MKQAGILRAGRTSYLLYHGIEFLLLGLAGPFLLFPSEKPGATVAVLVLLVLLWVGSLARGAPWRGTPFNRVLLPFAAMTGVGIIITSHPDLTLSKANGLSRSYSR